MNKLTGCVLGVLGLISTGCGEAPEADWQADESLTGFEQTSSALISSVDSDEIPVDRVRRCRGRVFCNSTQTRGEFRHWDRNGVAKDKQKRTYIARMAEPSRASTRYVVFLAAGQQDTVNINPVSGGLASGVTGQPFKFKNRFGNKRTGSQGGYELTHHSLAHWLVEDGESPFPADETFFAAAWDARFNHKFSERNKKRAVQAYADWLSDKFVARNVETMYLAGHSRGGCLVMRLAQELKRRHPSIPTIVHSFDGVCERASSEFGVSGRRVDNPASGQSNAWAYSTNMLTQFPSQSNLRILNLVGGYPVANVGILGVHAFSHTTATEEVFDLGWYEQRWLDLEHDDVDDFWRSDVREPAIEHLLSSFDTLNCDSGETWSSAAGSCIPECRTGYTWNGVSCVSNAFGRWSACSNFDDVCDINGTQSRAVTTTSCRGDNCSSVTSTQTRSCDRATDGVHCGVPTTTSRGQCVFENCSLESTKVRTLEQPICSGGTCSGSTQTTETDLCTREASNSSPCTPKHISPWSECEDGTQFRITLQRFCSLNACGIERAYREGQLCQELVPIDLPNPRETDLERLEGLEDQP